MSGSPVYFDGKLLGAVAYSWAYGKDPIAGVTPFREMKAYAEAYGAVGAKAARRELPLPSPVVAGGKSFSSVALAGGPGEAPPADSNALWLTPLQTPVAARGFSAHSLGLLAERLGGTGLTPVQAGGVTARAAKEAAKVPLQPGSPLAVALITGDFDMSGIGTVTHIEGDRVYGWGHPFMSGGACALPMCTGYIHTIYPRQSVSFKMGSPVEVVGVIDADVSTCIAGKLGAKADLVPLAMTVARPPTNAPRTFNCSVVRQKAMVPQLVFTALTNAVDMEGDLPDELTAELEAKLEFAGRPPVVIRDTYSGPSYAGGRAPAALYTPVGMLLQTVVNNPFAPVRVERVTCTTTLSEGRRTAEIEAVALDSETYAPGETLRATVTLKPYRGDREKVTVRLRLPENLTEGSYSVLVCDQPTSVRADLRETPALRDPADLDQLFETVKALASARRTHLAARLTVPSAGVTVNGQALPRLPGSMVEMLANGRRSGAQTMPVAVVAEQPTDWVVQGGQAVKFAVSRARRVTAE
jgi:hypothetical protein